MTVMSMIYLRNINILGEGKNMKRILILSLIFTFFMGISAQEKNDEQQKMYSTAPNFYLDFLNYKGDKPGKSRIDLFIQVPYTNIQFVKTDDNFTAKYSVNLTVYNENREDIIANKIWEETVTATNFVQTSSAKNFNLSLRTFSLEPGKYFVRCIVEDSDSKRNVTSEHTLDVLAFNNAVEVSDLLLITELIETPNGKRIVPNISQTVESMDSVIKFYYEAYSDIEQNVDIIYGIKDKNENQNYTHTISKDLQPGANEIYGSLQYPSFTFGDYEISVRVVNKEDSLLAGIGKTFYARVFGMPRSITDLENAIDQLVYIAEASEIEHIEEAESFSSKLDRYLAFWQKKDPTPATKVNEAMLEYYRRIEFANRNFEAYKRPGWQTDMGMVYTSLGPPDYIDRHPFAIDSKPYEVWDYYNLNRQFVFVDYSGFGDYRLVNRDYRDLNRYRY